MLEDKYENSVHLLQFVEVTGDVQPVGHRLIYLAVLELFSWTCVE